jgi:hypothetical protein
VASAAAHAQVSPRRATLRVQWPARVAYNWLKQREEERADPSPRPVLPEERVVDEAAFQKKLTDLVSEIESLPAADRDRLRQLAVETRDRHEQIRKSMNSLQDSIDFLRMSIKYLIFDLEATRRENSYLRRMLEQDPGQQQEPDGM